LADKPPEQEVEAQTDFYIDKPPERLFKPRKFGVDKETQVLDGELFDFDIEVAPILQVLMNKTLEQARMEVLEEEELKLMKEQQR
jgi:radial spoke head protein 3